MLFPSLSLPSLPLPKPSVGLQPLMVSIVLEEGGPRFGLFLGPTKVSVAGISPFANDVLCVILSSSPADTIMLCLSICPVYTELSTLKLPSFSSLHLSKDLFVV